MGDVFEVARRVDGGQIMGSWHGGFQALYAGASGSGKTSAAEVALLGMCEAYGSKIQMAIIDPKRVGWTCWERRAAVYADAMDWLTLADALCAEMQRRYVTMAERGWSEWEPTESAPFLLLVVDEMAAVTGAYELTKGQRAGLVASLTRLSHQGRQAGIGLLWICQQAAADVIPSEVRANCTTRVVLRTLGRSAVDMASGDRYEECRADLLTLPGQCYAMTSETRGMYVRGRVRWLPPREVARRVDAMAGDRRRLACLDWSSPDFLG